MVHSDHPIDFSLEEPSVLRAIADYDGQEVSMIISDSNKNVIACEFIDFTSVPLLAYVLFKVVIVESKRNRFIFISSKGNTNFDAKFQLFQCFLLFCCSASLFFCFVCFVVASTHLDTVDSLFAQLPARTPLTLTIKQSDGLINGFNVCHDFVLHIEIVPIARIDTSCKPNQVRSCNQPTFMSKW
jgi:hypothetical protein